MKSAPILGLMGGSTALVLGLITGVAAPLGLTQMGMLGLPLAALMGAYLAPAHPHRAAALMGGAAALLARLHDPAPLVTAAVALLGLAAVCALTDRSIRRNMAL